MSSTSDTSDSGKVLKVYEEDPHAENHYSETSDTLVAPKLCRIFEYSLTLLYDDPVVRISFGDLVPTEEVWEQVKTHPPVLVALTTSKSMRSGQSMAFCARNVGPTESIIFFDRTLTTLLEATKDTYQSHLLSFVCIVTVLHELRHWVRGVVKGMGKFSDERHLNWGVERGEGNPKGETGYLGEHRLWGGVLVGAFGSNPVRFSAYSQDKYGWADLKAVGMTQGRQGPLKKLHIYKWTYICDVVDRMETNMPFQAPVPGSSYASLSKGAYSPEQLRQLMEVDATTSRTLDLTQSTPYARRRLLSIATEKRYYPMMLQSDAPDSPSRTRSRTVPYEVDHPKKTWLRRLVARILRKDRHKLAFVPLTCPEVSVTTRGGQREP